MISINKPSASLKSLHYSLKQFQLSVLFVIISGVSTLMNAQGQHLRYVIGTECLATGSGLAGFTTPYLGISSKFNQFSLGAMIQNRTSEVQGLRMAYTRNLSGAVSQSDVLLPEKQGADLLEISCSAYFQYSQNAFISKAEAIAAQRINRRMEPSADFSSVRLNTLEGGFGVELRVNLTERIVWRNFVGAGYYYHLTYRKGLYMDRRGTSLLAGTGIQFNI